MRRPSWDGVVVLPHGGRISRGMVLALAAVLVASGSSAVPTVPAVAQATSAQPWTIRLPRSAHTATLLGDGSVLVAGGVGTSGAPRASVETWHPATGTASDAAPLREARAAHTATLLPDGRVLVVGGDGTSGQPLASSELRDTLAGRFGIASPLAVPRKSHTATLLPDGRVLVIGGTTTGGDALATSELWDPLDGAFASTGSLLEPRTHHAVVLLPDGRVLVVGGQGTVAPGTTGAVASAEIRDPVTGVFTTAGSMPEGRSDTTATLLPDGRVLVVGGEGPGGLAIASAMVWDPALETFSPAGTLGTPRARHSATLLADGRVLIVGGDAGGDEREPVGRIEIWDAATMSFTDAGRLATPRADHTTTLLPDGQAAVIAGDDGRAVSSVEVWDPRIGAIAWTTSGPLATARYGHTATLLDDGRVLLVGGGDDDGDAIGAAEVWDPTTGRSSQVGPLRTARSEHAAVLLPGGRVLVVGGYDQDVGPVATLEAWDPATGSFTRSGRLRVARQAPIAVTLSDGHVLVAGDRAGDGPMTAEIWDPVTTATGPARTVGRGQWFSRAVLLRNGRLLVIGAGDTLGDAQVWDPRTRRARDAGAMDMERAGGATLSLLPDGRVLVVGGEDPTADGGRATASAEIWDPATRDFVRTGSLGRARTGHTATVLSDGRVFVVGGITAADGGRTLASAEVWDPVTGTFGPAGTMRDARQGHTATLLRDGRVLVAGGQDDRLVLSSTDVWDPGTGTFAGSGGR